MIAHLDVDAAPLPQNTPRIAAVDRDGRVRVCRQARGAEQIALKEALCDWLARFDTWSDEQRAQAARVRGAWPGFASA